MTTATVEDATAQELPGIPHRLRINRSAFRRAVKAVAPAASKDGDRPIITGVHIRTTSDGDVVLEATDSYRLHRATLDGAANVGLATPGFEVLLSAAWLSRWARLGPGLLARFEVAELELVVEGDSVQLLDPSRHETYGCRAIAGEYPNTQRLTDGIVDRPAAEVAVNPKYFAELLAAAATWGDASGLRPLRVRHLDPMKPCLFTVAGEGGYLDLLIMPVRVP